MLPLDTDPPGTRYNRARCKVAIKASQDLADTYRHDPFTREYWRGCEREWQQRWHRGFD